MTLYEKLKNQSIEEMAKYRVECSYKKVCLNFAADAWGGEYTTSDGQKFWWNKKEEAIKHEIELLSK